ncbi:MAG: transglutaminase domain-containing protein [Candidatus Helarchaeota archaeon]
MSESGSGTHIGKGTIILILLLTSFGIMAALPASFYLNMGDMAQNMLNENMMEQFMDYLDRFPLFDFTGNFSDFLDFFDFPTDNPINPGDYVIPEEWQIPGLDWGELLEGWNGELPSDLPEDLPDGFEIPDGWLPDGVDPGDYPGLIGLGLGLFGTEYIKVWVNSTPPNRYWKLRTYDTFNSSNWVQSNDTVFSYDYTSKSPIPSDEKYLVWMNITYEQNGSGSLPIPHLWPTGEIIENVSVYSSATVSWNLLQDASGSVIWNATISDAPSSEFVISIVYNTTFDESITPTSIISQMTSQIVDGTPFDPPGETKYRQLPTLDPEVISDMENVKNQVFSKNLNIYNATLSVLEYFKTRYTWIASADYPQQFNASRLIKNGNGTTSDFASNFALYLRYLNISTRLIWGGVGYYKDTSSPTINNMYRLTPIFYTEVWIPNSTNTGGYWMQFDPTPFPNQTYGITGPGSYSTVYPRIPDDRLNTFHYDLLLTTNTSNFLNPVNHLNRNTDSFLLNATLLRDGTILSQTMLGDFINFTFYDETDNKILGYNTSNPATWTDSFDSNSIVGPHKIFARFFAIKNKTIIVLNDTTSTIKDGLGNPIPIQTKRGTGNSFIFYTKLIDPVSNRPIIGEDLYANISSTQLIRNNPNNYTNSSGLLPLNLTVPSTVSSGTHNMFTYFNGIFSIDPDFPQLPPIYVFVTAAPSISPNHLIIVEADINISLYKDTDFQNEIIVRNNNVLLFGQVAFDNGTSISNAPVDIHWQNSSGEFIFGHLYTNSTGWYNYTLHISNLHDSSVLIWANTTLPYGNKSTSINANIYCQDTTILHLYDPNPGPYVIRNSSTLSIRGYLLDPQGVADMSGQIINLYDKSSGTKITSDGDIITDINGNFSTSIPISSNTPVGYHDIYANFNGTWNADGTPIDIPSSASNSSEYSILVVAQTLLVKDISSMLSGRNLYPPGFIPIGENLDIYGYLALDNQTALSGKTVNAWETFQNGTTILLGSDITNGTGFYNITYAVPPSHPTGNTIIFVNHSAGNIFTSYRTNATASEDPEFGYLCNLIINSITPSSAVRGVHQITVQGTLNEIYYGTDLSGETLYITFNSSHIRDNNFQEVTTQVDGSGSFTANFIVSNSISQAEYQVNATPISSLIHYNQSITSDVIINASSAISSVEIAQTAMVGEYLNISGNLVFENGTKLAGSITIYPESNSSKNYTVAVNGDFNLSLPIDSSFANKNDNLIIQYNGAPKILSTSVSVPFYVGDSPAILVDPPLSAYQNLPFSVYGSVSQNGNPYFNRPVILSIYNSTHHNIFNITVNTDSNGNYIANIQIPIVGNYTIKAILNSNSGTFTSSEIPITITPGPNIFDMLWVLWIIIPVVAGVIIAILGVKMAVRRREKKKKQIIVEKIDPNKIKNNIQALCDGKRFKEAIIYVYLSFLEIVAIHKGKRRQPSQTIREFAMDLVKNMKLSPKNIYSLTNLYEEARFSNHNIDKNKFEEAKLLYDQLVAPIVKKATLS